MTWFIEPLEGKYYGTRIVHEPTGNLIKVWLPVDHVQDYRVSDRELEKGWDPEECTYDHTEMQHTYEAACIIMNALNKEEE